MPGEKRARFVVGSSASSAAATTSKKTLGTPKSIPTRMYAPWSSQSDVLSQPIVGTQGSTSVPKPNKNSKNM